MADCKECYRYNLCLLENTSIAIVASKQGMEANCYRFFHKDTYNTRTSKEGVKRNG